MSLAPQELENSASKYAADAIKADSQGAIGMAISGYQNASETLMKLMRLYPDSKLNRIYTERMQKYQGRIKDLRNTRAGNVEPVVEKSSVQVNKNITEPPSEEEPELDRWELKRRKREAMFAKYGGYFATGGEAEIDVNMYKQLIAAGADIEII